MSVLMLLPPDVEKVWITVDKALLSWFFKVFNYKSKERHVGFLRMRSLSSKLSTISTGLSTEIEDNFPALTCGFTLYPQKTAPPITTIFIYRYLSPQANLFIKQIKSAHSLFPTFYAKLSNLEGEVSQMNIKMIEMRASA
jgi:hypothetical protein